MVKAASRKKMEKRAERIVEFSKEDMRENTSIVHLSESLITPEIWQEFAEEALVFIDGWNILQYAEEFPIVKYQCDELACQLMQPDYRLNSFIKSITVSTALQGKSFSVGSGKMEGKITDCDTVVYYEDNYGICHAVIQHDIYHMLIQKPKLVISPEGVLLFYTDSEILSTIDCQHYYWLNGWIIDVDGREIIGIEAYDDHCEVVLDEEGAETYLRYKLNFGFDFLNSTSGFIPRATKI